jgi:protein-tyrosine phosphatase
MWSGTPLEILQRQRPTTLGLSPSFILPSLFLSGDSVSAVALQRQGVRLIIDARVESPLRQVCAPPSADVLMLDTEFRQGYKYPQLTSQKVSVLTSMENAKILLRELILDTENLEGTRFVVFSFPAHDHESFQIIKYFEASSAIIDFALGLGAGVLVHCAAGVSRSPSIIAAFLCQKFKIQSEAAIALLRQKRPMVNPNAGCRDQLQKWSLSVLQQHGCAVLVNVPPTESVDDKPAPVES